MSLTSVEKYKAFDFASSEDFKRFLTELEPSIPVGMQEYVRRLWYRKMIDQQFDTNYDGTMPNLPSDLPESEEHFHDGEKCTGHHDNHNDRNSSSHTEANKGKGGKRGGPLPAYEEKSMIAKIAYNIENYLKMMTIMSSFWFQGFAQFACLFVCILAIIRQLKRPQLSRQYLLKLSQNQFAQNLLYMLAFAFHKEQRNLLYYFPLLIHFWIGICEFLNFKKNAMYNKGKVLINRTRQSKNNLMKLRCQYEVILLFVLFVEIFIGRSSIFLVLFYYNYLKIKFLISDTMQLVFTNVNEACKKKLEGKNVPQAVKYAYNKIEALLIWTVKYDTKTKKDEQQTPEISTPTKTATTATTAEESAATATENKDK